MSNKNASNNNTKSSKALRIQPKPLEVPDWFGDGSDIPPSELKTDICFTHFPDWASHQEWEAPPDDSNEFIVSKIHFKTPYSTEDNIHVWDRQDLKLPPINQKQQGKKITKAEKPFWNPKPEKSFKSPNSKKGAPVPVEPENIKMFDLISMQYQKDWLSQTKNKEHERIQKTRHVKEQQKAKLLEHAVKKRDTNTKTEDTTKELFKLARFSNVPSRYLNNQLSN